MRWPRAVVSTILVTSVGSSSGARSSRRRRIACRPTIRIPNRRCMQSQVEGRRATTQQDNGGVLMDVTLGSEQRHDLLRRGFSRRDLTRVAAMVAGAAGLIPFWNEPALAQLSQVAGGVPDDAVKIDANENPLGPCPEAIEAVRAMALRGGRYLYSQADTLAETLAQVEGLQS